MYIQIQIHTCTHTHADTESEWYQVETLLSLFFFGEVAQQMTAMWTQLTQNIKQERGAVELQRLVVQEQLGNQTEVLAVDGLPVPIHLSAQRVQMISLCV